MPTYRPLPAVGKPEPVSTYGNTQNAHGTRSAGNNLAAQINQFIARYEPGAPLAGKGDMLVRVGREEGVDPRVLAIIARKESQFGKTSGRYTNNAWGWGVHLGPDVYTSRTWEEGARKVARGLAGSLYKGAGKNTLASIIQTYAPPSENDTGTYIRQIQGWYREMGGNPNANVFSPAAVGGRGGGGNRPARGNRPAQPGAETPPAQAGPPTRTLQTAGSYRPGMVAIAPRTLALMQQYVNQSEADVMQGYMPGDVEPVLSGIDFDYRPPHVTPGEMLTVPGVPTPAGKPGRGKTRKAASTGGSDVIQRPKGGIAPILPGQPQWGSFGYSDPEGQGGRHMAVDWFAPAGTKVASPVTGRVVRVTADPNPGQRASGQVFGGTLGIRAPDGKLYVMRHITPVGMREGMQVRAGQAVGAVKDWSGSTHIHFEVYRKGSSDREYSAGMALNPRDIYREIFK